MIELKDDKLNRKPFLDSLFSLFNNFGNQGNKGLTILINGKYGSGKTTTLGFIKEQNSVLNKFSVIEYNAWENNLFDNPLIPVLNEINQLNSTKNKIKDTALKVLKSLPKMFFATLANAHSIDANPLLESLSENIFNDFKEYRDSLNEYRKILTEYCINQKVLFLVDELDRCLPEYQIKVLETIYHILNIPNLIVVIALDKEQLECSIKNYFGEEKNIFGYLAKFIDFQIDLPNNNDLNFIRSLMKFECIGGFTESVKSLIVKMFDLVGFSIRECQHLVNEINLICNAIDYNGEPREVIYWYPPLVAIVLATKYLYASIYNKWFLNEKKEDYRYSSTKIALKDSKFFEFIEDIKNTKLELFIEYLTELNEYSDIPRSFLINLINVFIPFKLINENDLAKYTGFDVEDISNFRTENRYPYAINDIIKKVKMLNF